MCGESFYAMGQGVTASLRKWGPDFLDDTIVAYLKGHDLVLCNVECVLSDLGANRYSLRRSQMRGRPLDAKLLHQWGLNVANVANNHILEHGLEAAVDTVRNLKNAGLNVVGAGQNGNFGGDIGATQLSLKGQDISILGVCLRNEKYAYFTEQWDSLIDTVQALSRNNTSVIVSIHWGDELMDRPGIAIKDRANQLRDAGAVVIAGHHPHVVQGIENHQGRLTAYSLGNFIFNGFLPDTRWSVILSLTLSGNHVKEWEYKIIEQDQDHRPQFPGHQRLADLDREMQRRNALLECSLSSEDYEQKYKEDLCCHHETAKKELHEYVRKRFWTYPPIFWPQVLLRPVKRRLGLW